MGSSDSKMVSIKKATYSRLAKHGNLEDSFDSVINRLLDIYEGKRKTKEVLS
jgi:predicted CopG family antitoxin